GQLRERLAGQAGEERDARELVRGCRRAGAHSSSSPAQSRCSSGSWCSGYRMASSCLCRSVPASSCSFSVGSGLSCIASPIVGRVGGLGGGRFCPKCAESIERHDGSVTCPACGFVAYANSAPTASALVEDDEGRLLMVRRAIDPYRGMWDLPGGFLEE